MIVFLNEFLNGLLHVKKYSISSCLSLELRFTFNLNEQNKVQIIN